jgi:plastocyanin
MQGGHSFSPGNATAPAGGTVQWKNADPFRHTVASDTNVAGMNSEGAFPGGVPAGSTFSWTVPAGAASGTVYYYHCAIHGGPGNGTSLGTGMAGSITVQ